MSARPEGREAGERAGGPTQGGKRGRGAMGVECTLVVLGTGGPVENKVVLYHIPSIPCEFAPVPATSRPFSSNGS
eukprot:8613398-Pyramimonas_sp.AAC.1